MTIINQNKSAVINYDHVSEIYIGADNKSIKVDFANGKGCQVASYPTTEKASGVLFHFLQEVRSGAAVYEFPAEKVKL